MNEFKCVAPDFDRMIHRFERHYNPEAPTKSILPLLDALFDLLSPLAPLKKNKEAKAIWITVPRGTIEDFGDYDEMVEFDEVKSREEFEELWAREYPEETCWYEVVIVESLNKDGSLFYRGVSVGHKTIVNALMQEEPLDQNWFLRDIPDQLLTLIMDPVRESLKKLEDGTYNDWVSSSLPYQFRTGVIRRSVLWQYEPDYKGGDRDGLDEQMVEKFRELIDINDEDKIARLPSFTANDFFNACKIGYEACGKETAGYSLSELYVHYADGRDEGLTGTGMGLNEGPGIDFDDPAAWDEWYFSSRGGGHPWEVIPGGNSTHMNLFVRHDRSHLDWKHRLGELSDEEYEKRMEKAGYYFHIAGKHRPFESVTFYTALSAAGLPVVLSDAKEILARFDGSDYIGIVPHSTFPRYCEEMFPERFGHVIDFMHVYDEDMEKFGNEIEWLPETPAELNP